MKYIFSILILGLCGTLFSQNSHQFFGQYHQKRDFSTPDTFQWKAWDSTATADAQVFISMHDTLAPVLSTQFGVNTTFRSGSQMATDGIRLPMYRQAKLNTYRFPAGSGSNQYFWDGQIPNDFLISDVKPIDGTKNGNLTSDLFLNFLDSVNGEGIIVVNYFYARYGKTTSGTRQARVRQAASYAAQWVRYMNVVRGANIKYWEIGNECYGRWEVGWDVNGSIVTGKEYGEDLRVFADSMKAVDPSIKVGAVLHHTDASWNQQVLAEVQDKADFLIVHQYFTPPTSNAQQIFNEVPKVTQIAQDVRTQVAQHTNKAADHFPICMTEFNSRGRHRITMANGLFVSQVLAELIKNRYSLSSLWVGEWKFKDTEENTTAGFLALEDGDQPDYSARPSYMPFHLYGKCFGDQMIDASVSGDSALKVYASRFQSGEMGLVLVNPTANSRTVSFQADSTFDMDNAFWYEFYARNIDVGNKTFFLNGAGPTTASGGPANFARVPFFRERNITNKLFSARPWSVNFIVLQGEKGPKTSLGSLEKNDIRIFPNPVREKLFIQSEKTISAVEVMDLNGKSCLQQKGHVTSLDTSSLSKGYYVLFIESEKERLKIPFFIR